MERLDPLNQIFLKDLVQLYLVKSSVGRVLYDVFDDAWVTAQCFTIGYNNAFHLSGTYTIGNETVNAGLNTMTNFAPLGSLVSYLGIGEKTLNAGQFNKLMKGSGITPATDRGVQILRYNNSIRQSKHFDKMRNSIGPASTVLGYWQLNTILCFMDLSYFVSLVFYYAG